MHLIVGLGNPGPEYARTRHNIGFRCLDRLAARHGLEFGRVKDGCRIVVGRIVGHDVVLVKPMRYMNLSGEALAVWAARTAMELVLPDPDGLVRPVTPLIVVDDIALPLGALRLRARGSDGGHRGLESLARTLGGDDYPRLRLGVAPAAAAVPADQWKSFVLEEFDHQEWDDSEELVDYACDTLTAWLENGLEWTGSRYNRKRPEADDGPRDRDLLKGSE